MRDAETVMGPCRVALPAGGLSPGLGHSIQRVVASSSAWTLTARRDRRAVRVGGVLCAEQPGSTLTDVNRQWEERATAGPYSGQVARLLTADDDAVPVGVHALYDAPGGPG